MAYAWKAEHPRAKYAGLDVRDEIIFKRHVAQWILPYCLAEHLAKTVNPRNLPVVQTEVFADHEGVFIWVGTSTCYDFDKRLVFAVVRENEDYYLRMSIDRIDHGHRVFTPTPLPPSPYV